MLLLEWALTNNYCTFDNNIYLQLQQTAMGTPVTVNFSNIFLVQLICPTYSIWMDGSSSIQFDAVIIDKTGVMLDLEFDFIPYPFIPNV